jgi:hypothetical protein
MQQKNALHCYTLKQQSQPSRLWGSRLDLAFPPKNLRLLRRKIGPRCSNLVIGIRPVTIRATLSPSSLLPSTSPKCDSKINSHRAFTISLPYKQASSQSQRLRPRAQRHHALQPHRQSPLTLFFGRSVYSPNLPRSRLRFALLFSIWQLFHGGCTATFSAIQCVIKRNDHTVLRVLM